MLEMVYPAFLYLVPFRLSGFSVGGGGGGLFICMANETATPVQAGAVLA